MAGFDENKADEQERVILAAVWGRSENEASVSLEELGELVRTAGAVCVGTLTQRLEYENNVTYLGKGKLEELRTMLVALDATGIVCDTELSAVQMRNLTRELGVKVMDRTMVILDIFAARARTREGKIQVELAQLKYNSTMLVGLRDSLSRLGGGIGTRGLGEKKLEMDRRLIREQISRLKRELEDVKRHRQTQRKQRERKGCSVVCIVGYTNAGKSTLLNRLTGAGVLSEDKLFATLDPTTRMLKLEEGQEVMVTDTVGFISRLPHHLRHYKSGKCETVCRRDSGKNLGHGIGNCHMEHLIHCAAPQDLRCLKQRLWGTLYSLLGKGCNGKPCTNNDQKYCRRIGGRKKRQCKGHPCHCWDHTRDMKDRFDPIFHFWKPSDQNPR